jgi:hypothetical protein
VRVWALAAVAAAGAGLASAATGGRPQGGILEPAGGGVQIAYTLGASSLRCSYVRAGGPPRLACGTRQANGGTPRRAFAATMDPRRVVFLQVRAGGQTRLAAFPQRAGVPVYGPFRQERKPRIVQLLQGATIGFIGTNIGCTAQRYGNGPALRCFAHGPGGLPGPCCGPNYPLLVKSFGFFLTPRRLQALRVVRSGVTQVANGAATGPLPPPYRVVRNWHL